MATRASVATDNFDAYAHDSNLGGQGNWTQMDGYWGNARCIKPASDGTFAGSGGSIFSDVRNSQTFSNDQYVSARVAVKAGSANEYIGVGVRLSGSIATGTELRKGYWFILLQDSGTVREMLLRKYGGSPSTIEWYNGSTWQSGQTYFGSNASWAVGDFVEMEVVGTEIKCIRSTSGGGRGALDDVRLTITDSNVSTGTPGLVGRANAQDFRGDDWEGGDLTAGASVVVSSVGDTSLDDGQTGVTITGTGFPTSAGTRAVIISPTDDVDDAAAETQTVTAWTSATSITFTAVRGALNHSTNLYLFVIDNDGNSNAAGSVVQFNAIKKLKLLVNSAAVGATVDGVVFEAPVSGIVGAEVGEFTGKSIAAGSGADAGKGVLLVPVADFGGGSLVADDEPLVYLKNSTNFTPIWPGLVIEE